MPVTVKAPIFRELMVRPPIAAAVTLAATLMLSATTPAVIALAE